MRITFALMLICLPACDDDAESTDVGNGAIDAGSNDGGDPTDLGFTGLDGTTDIGPEIDVNPPILQLLGEVGQASAPMALAIRNVGTDPLEVTGAEITGAGFDLVEVPAWPVTVAPGEQVTVSVTYTPPNAGRNEGAVTISSNDADEPTVRVPLNGRIQMSCLRAMPSTVELGAVEPGSDSGRFQAQVVNCGDVPVAIGEVTLEGDEGFNWEVEGGDPLAESTLEPGQAARIQLWYSNMGLAPDEMVNGAVVLQTDAARTPELRINMRARGGGGPSCLLTISPPRVDFEFLRIGLTRTLEVRVDNPGTDVCRLDDVRIIDMDGPEENTFTVTTDLPRGEIGPRTEQIVEVTYAPTIAFPPGDRVLLRVEFHDPHLEQNRAQESLLRGIGAEALTAAMPDSAYFGEVTNARCASPTIRIRADNAGFVPMCITGFRYEGDECPRFVPLEEPVIEGDCLHLEPEDFSEFLFQYEPTDLREENRDRCTLVVESDAMNRPELEVPLSGAPVEGDATIDSHEVGRLRDDRNAHFSMRRPAVEDSIRVFVEDEPNDDWEFAVNNGSIYFEPGDHPDEDDIVRIEYDAVCFDRAGD